MRKNKGFTLVEILIVVVILGILAAIVIPQFTDASTQSKVSSAKSSLQTMRSQIELYKIQHTNDTPPTLAAFATQMTEQSNAAGTQVVADGPVIYGPYLQEIPVNPMNGSSTVVAADAADAGWVYTEADGTIQCGGLGSTEVNGVSENWIDW